MARIGGAFPLPLAQVQEGGTRVDLDSGGVFYPPPGEYVYNLPSNVQIEYFDRTGAVVADSRPIGIDWRLSVSGMATTSAFTMSPALSIRSPFRRPVRRRLNGIGRQHRALASLLPPQIPYGDQQCHRLRYRWRYSGRADHHAGR